MCITPRYPHSTDDGQARQEIEPLGQEVLSDIEVSGPHADRHHEQAGHGGGPGILQLSEPVVNSWRANIRSLFKLVKELPRFRRA